MAVFHAFSTTISRTGHLRGIFPRTSAPPDFGPGRPRGPVVPVRDLRSVPRFEPRGLKGKLKDSPAHSEFLRPLIPGEIVRSFKVGHAIGLISITGGSPFSGHGFQKGKTGNRLWIDGHPHANDVCQRVHWDNKTF